MKRILAASIMLFGLAFPAWAHVTVQPNSVGVAQRETFNVSVPNEKDNPTVSLRLVLPVGLQSVTPNVKPGWKIEIKKTGDGEDAVASEIIWTGGSIPSDLRDDFYFRAQVPATAGEIIWKAYQTYQDGSVVAWDQAPSEEEGDNTGPYSVTRVVDDLADASVMDTDANDTSDNLAMMLGWGAIGIAIVSLIASLSKRPG